MTGNPALGGGGQCPTSGGTFVDVGVTPLFGPENNTLTEYLDYLRTDATYAYWLSGFQTFYRAPLAGGVPEELFKLESDGSLWTDVVLTEDSLLFRDGGSLKRLPKTGGSAEEVASPSGFSIASTLRTMALDGSTLYAINSGSLTCSASASVVAISLEDGSERVLTEELRCPDDMTMDADALYVSVSGPIDPTDYKQHEPSLVRIPKAGGSVQVLETGTAITRLRTDEGGYVYGLVGGQEEAGTALVRVSKTGGAVETVVGSDCGFQSDMLELVDGNLMYSEYDNLVIVSPDGDVLFTLHNDDYQLGSGHEEISVHGKQVTLLTTRRVVGTFALP